MMMTLTHQKLYQSLKQRVSEAGGRYKESNLREIEDAWQYGEAETLELFDRVLHCGYSLYFVRIGLRNAALILGDTIVPKLTEEHLRAFAAIPGGSELSDGRMASILKLIMDHPDESLLIASIMRDRKITDPDRIGELITEQRESASAFSSGVL